MESQTVAKVLEMEDKFKKGVKMKIMKRVRYYNRFQPLVLFIKVDESCNLRCKFCYQIKKENNRMDTEEKFKKCFENIDLAINKFLKFVDNEYYDQSQLCICFFGGEPTLNTEAINKICKYIKNNYPLEVRNRIGLTYTTNGILFNEDIKDTLKFMKSVNDLYTTVMISTDNSKEVYDKNRHLIGSNKSGYEMVKENIKKYKEYLKELNGIYYKKDITIATVLADEEQLLNNPMVLQNEYKNILRRGKLLYSEGVEISEEYIEASKEFLSKAYTALIENCTKEKKEESLEEILDSVFQLYDDDIFFTECQGLSTIDANGEINWCNKHKNFEDEVLSQNKMKEYMFNPNVDNSHFRCVREKLKNGDKTKSKLQPKMWEKLISRFDINVPISKVNIYFTEEKLIYDFIKFMVGSTEAEEREVYITNPSEKIINLCKEFDIKISKQPIKSDVENTFYVDQEGNLFFDEIFKDDKNMILTDLKEKHFMWIHTPTLLNSVNKYFLEKLSY